MKKKAWQKYLSLLLSLVIVFNITMIPAFADEDGSTGAPAQEEQEALGDAADDPETAESEAPEESSGEVEPEEEQKEAEAEEPEAEPEAEAEEPVEAPKETEPEKHVGGEGKYVADVFIAYEKTEERAKQWLRKHGWEPLNGNADFNAGKASFFDNNSIQDQNVAAVMGIRRTDNADEAITDMAVMNMKGGYSFPDYESLVKEKKAEINEFINTFIPVLEEYRKNYNGKGSALGKKRAELAHDLLNSFFDGGKKEQYAVNDTGKPLGDLFLAKTMQEGNGKGGDLQQIILESSGAAVTTIETCLALGADAEKTSWLERLKDLSDEELSENIEKYVPEAKGQDLAPSAVKQLLKQHFGDQAKILAGQWESIHEKLLGFEEYNDKNDLWQHDGEKDADYEKRLKEYFDKLHKNADGEFSDEQKEYCKSAQLYTGLYLTPYEGEWGETLGDFFDPAEGSGYADDVNKFLPVAAALSKGQRSAVELVSLESLLILGMSTEESVAGIFPEVKKLLGGAKAISIYSGINRGIFRGGVALTNAALMEKNKNGSDPFADMWSFAGVYNITAYASMITGAVLMGVGFGIARNASGHLSTLGKQIVSAESKLRASESAHGDVADLLNRILEGREPNAYKYSRDALVKEMHGHSGDIEKYQSEINNLNKDLAPYQKMATTGRVILGIGGALLIGAAVAKGYQLYSYYNTTFTQIPMYIVDEADIVSYETDDEGNEKKLIDFDQFVYYEAVKCNRQEMRNIGDRQSGVSRYAEWGCGDAADLNADMGQQWLALYTVGSSRKGSPILADSLTLQYGSGNMPEGTTKALHMFTYENAADLGDTAYSYNNDKNGVYFFWDVDEEAAQGSDAASTFAGGSTALAGGIGLLVGILGTAIVLRRKKKEA